MTAPDESLVTCPDYYVIPGLTLEGGEPLTVWHVVRAMNLNHQVGNVLKYAVRAGRKPGQPYAKDMRKIVHCTNAELRRLDDHPPGAV
jgi:hypothetical protein